VKFPNDEEAVVAIPALDGKELGGRKLKVNEARPKAERTIAHLHASRANPAGSLKYGLCAIVSVHCNLKEIECHPHSKSARRK
jgi:RNA recognition motif-containing protein